MDGHWLIAGAWPRAGKPAAAAIPKTTMKDVRRKGMMFVLDVMRYASATRVGARACAGSIRPEQPPKSYRTGRKSWEIRRHPLRARPFTFGSLVPTGQRLRMSRAGRQSPNEIGRL